MKRMTKKSRFARGLAIVLAIAVLFALVPLLTSCLGVDSEVPLDGVHIFCPNGEDLCIPIRRASTNADGANIYPREGSRFFVSSGTYLLYSKTCPICSRNEPIE